MRDGDGFRLPPAVTDENGQIRRVGVELEFGSITCETGARCLQDALGGHVTAEDEYLYHLTGSGLGDLTIKLDTRYAHAEAWHDGWPDELKSFLAEMAGKVGSYVLPAELITPPLTFDELPSFERAIEILRDAGASGTLDEPLFAFALHLNPETPSRQSRVMVSIMKAFVALDRWLRDELHPKALRKALRFAEPYPESYCRLLARPDYWPARRQLIEDYLDANPTRNRDLDMLPLFLNIDERHVRKRLPDEKIGNRPAFHYRLPGSRISDPDWNLKGVWNTWVAVETLAADEQRLGRICEAYLSFQGTADEWSQRAAVIAFGPN